MTNTAVTATSEPRHRAGRSRSPASSSPRAIELQRDRVNVDARDRVRRSRAAGMGYAERPMGEMPCDVCGSFEHEDHPQCSYCGSDQHVEHPTCSYCGSYDHDEHPRCGYCGSYDHDEHPRCGYCGSYDHDEHPRCGYCGSYDHEVHPHCSVCGSDAHTDHEEGYLTEGDIGLYWTTLRVFTKKLATLLKELEQESVWMKVEPEWPESAGPIEVVANPWKVGLFSTTNTLAALLKVPIGFDTLLEGTIKRSNVESSERLVLARNLLGLAQELLADFDVLSSGRTSGGGVLGREE
jgi:hypothetical protein